MHELAIADAIARIASEHSGGRRITAVAVKVGYLRQVVPSALEFSWQLLTDGTAAEGARLELEEVPVGGRCRGCGTEAVLPAFPLACPACGGLDVDVTTGQELLVESVELEEDDATMASRGRAA